MVESVRIEVKVGFEEEGIKVHSPGQFSVVRLTCWLVPERRFALTSIEAVFC